jgi:NAD(P)H-hydrate repair Nnr-like enzyme with NAD(P)H-hydrate dehydratase domain
MSGFEGAQLAVFLHSAAGRLAAEKIGHRAMTASDVIAEIGQALREVLV